MLTFSHGTNAHTVLTRSLPASGVSQVWLPSPWEATTGRVLTLTEEETEAPRSLVNLCLNQVRLAVKWSWDPKLNENPLEGEKTD